MGAEPALPVVDPLPLMPEPPLAAGLPPDEPLPLAPERELPIEPEPDPEAAVFSLGCPVAKSRQWVAGENEEEPELVPDEPA